MDKFHIRKDGNAGKCSAQPGNCPLGADEPHYDTPEAAREGYAKKVDQWLAHMDERSELESSVDLYSGAIEETKIQLKGMDAEIDEMGMDHPSYGDALRAQDSLYRSMWDDEEKLKYYQEQLDELEEVEDPFEQNEKKPAEDKEAGPSVPSEWHVKGWNPPTVKALAEAWESAKEHGYGDGPENFFDDYLAYSEKSDSADPQAFLNSIAIRKN